MGKKKTVLKVPITCQKCQTDIMKAVAKISGIEKMEVDASKGTLTIIGEVEPVPIFKKLKKIGKTPEIVSVGPPKPQPQQHVVKCDQWCTCNLCRPYAPFTPAHYAYVPAYYPPPYESDTQSSCSIM